MESALAAADEGANVTAGAARVIVISGTGASCFGKTAAGGEILTGGWGHLLGDRGSGYDIALRACQAVFAGLDESGRWPALGVRLLTVLQLNSPAEMVSWHGRATKAETAALAVEVFAAAAKGDKTAKSILNEAAAAITRSATACAGRLTRKGNRVEFVLTGSILIKQRGFSRLVERQLAAAWPVATVRVLRREAAWGALPMVGRMKARGEYAKASSSYSQSQSCSGERSQAASARPRRRASRARIRAARPAPNCARATATAPRAVRKAAAVAGVTCGIWRIYAARETGGRKIL